MSTTFMRALFAFVRGTRTWILAVVIGLLIPVTMAAQGTDYPPASSGNKPAQDQDEYGTPGQPSGNDKLQATLGPIKLRFYGMVLLNTSFEDNAFVGGEVPLWPVSGAGTFTYPDGTKVLNDKVHDAVFTARQSTFGFNFGTANPIAKGWNPSGVLEFDFFGDRPSDATQPQGRVFNAPRLRKAYFTIEKGMWRIVAGQDNVIIAPLDPVSLSHVGIPLGATAGDLWGWLPQVRLDMTNHMGKFTSLVQVGVLRPLFGDPKLGDQPTAGTTTLVDTFSGFGERTTQPFYQARWAISHPMSGSTATVGLGGHFGQEQVGASQRIDSWAFAYDFQLPVQSRLILRGEGYVGSNLIPFQGGIDQGVAVAPNVPPPGPFTTIQPIGDVGGWAELTILATKNNRNIFYLGAGTDDPENSDLLASATRQKNTFYWATYFRKLTRDVTLGVELSNWQFRTASFGNTGNLQKGPFARGNVVNVSLAYEF